MKTETFTFWEHLAEEIEPFMQMGESLINKTIPLVEKYHVDLTSITDWKEWPAGLQNELKSHIVSLSDNIPDLPLLNELLKTGALYQNIFEKLEIQYFRLDKRDASARTLLLHLMEEVMNASITSGSMKLSDWHELFENRKEVSRVENVGEYIYKKVFTAHHPREEMNIYDYFYNKTSPDEIDKLLGEAKDSILLASTHRGQTKKRGQGMSRYIINCIHHWQSEELMKPLKSVFPFCQCLQLHWNNEINLGTRQGLEATYKQRF